MNNNINQSTNNTIGVDVVQMENNSATPTTPNSNFESGKKNSGRKQKNEKAANFIILVSL